MVLINYETNFIINWFKECFVYSNTLTVQATAFAILDKKRYVPVVTLSTQDNAKLLEQ